MLTGFRDSLPKFGLSDCLESAIMSKSRKTVKKPGTRNLVGAVMLTASLSLLAVPDALAESCGSSGVSILGAMSGSDRVASGSANCFVGDNTQSSDRPDQLAGY